MFLKIFLKSLRNSSVPKMIMENKAEKPDAHPLPGSQGRHPRWWTAMLAGAVEMTSWVGTLLTTRLSFLMSHHPGWGRSRKSLTSPPNGSRSPNTWKRWGKVTAQRRPGDMSTGCHTVSWMGPQNRKTLGENHGNTNKLWPLVHSNVLMVAP